MEKLSVIFCVLSILIGASSAFAEQTLEIAVLFPGTVEFFSAEKKGMDKAAEEFGLKLTSRTLNGMPVSNSLR